MNDKLNPKLLEILACPRCLGRLQYDVDNQRLICRFEHLAYPIEQGIPHLKAQHAIALPPQE